MICERCFQPEDVGEHGLYKCPLQPRPRNVAVWQDSIEGGIEIGHGLCNADGTPKRYYSRTEIKDACRAKGLVPFHEVWKEDGNPTLLDARAKDDWLRSGEAARARRDRVEARQEKYLKRDREAARMR